MDGWVVDKVNDRMHFSDVAAAAVVVVVMTNC